MSGSVYFSLGHICKKIPTPTQTIVVQKAGLRYKRIKFDLEADEVSLYNELMSSGSGNPQPNELT